MNVGWKSFILWLAPCVVALLLLEALLRPNPLVRNYEMFTEMVYSKAYESLSPSPELAGGMTQQSIPEGVVTRDVAPFHYGLGQDEAQRAGRELHNPVATNAKAIERGALLYKRFCVVCHGGDGAGQGPVVQRGMLPPPSLSAARAMQMPDGEMFHVLTKGQGNMASFDAEIEAEDRWKVILHVRRIQETSR